MYWELVFILLDGSGVIRGVPLMARFRRWVGFGCFYRYALLLLFSILCPYCVVVALIVFFVGRLRVLSYVW